MKIAVIGAGFGGLSAAALLAQKGFSVNVYEKNDQPGGRAALFRESGFSFDMGPSWYLIPEVFEHFFSQFDKKPEDFFHLTHLDPHYRVFFDSGQVVDIPAGVSQAYKVFNELEPNGGEKLKRYLAQAKYQYDVAMKKLIYRNYRSILDLIDPMLILQGLKLKVFRSMEDHSRQFFTSNKARKIVEYTNVFLGGDPGDTPAFYSLMAHIDFNLGVWYPTGGLNAVAKAIYGLCESAGVRFHFNHEIEKIEIDQQTITSLSIKGLDAPVNDFDTVIANADYHWVETKLLNQKHQTYPEKYWQKKTIAPCTFLIYLGINRRIPQLQHHNLFLRENWQPHFDSVFKTKTWPGQPSYYVCAASRTDPGIAPASCENLFVLVPVAAGLDDRGNQPEKFADQIIADLEQQIHESIKDKIVVKRILAHREFKELFHAYQGTGLGLSHTLWQTALFRPAIKSKKVNNLYFTGQYTQPGIGVPMTLVSAEIAVEQIIKDQSQKK